MKSFLFLKITMLTIQKDRVYGKNLLENKKMLYQNKVKNIQTAAYNGART